MDNNKTFFYHHIISGGSLVSGTGYVNTNLDLRRILGAKFDKYEAFNLAVEAFITDGGSTSNGSGTNKSTLCLHVSGFPFMNNYYDSLQQYSSSRVMEVISSNGDQDFNYDTNNLYFLQNTHRIPFYRPSTPIIERLVLFLTAPDGTLYERLGPTNVGLYACIFSITGIDTYRVRRIPRPLIYRSFNKPNPTLVLNSAYATSIDPIDTTAFKKRIFRFDNVNWREIIGNELYSKYDKFALVLRRQTFNYQSVTYTGFPGLFVLLLSGSNLVFEYKGAYQFYPISSATNNLQGDGNPVIIGFMRGFSGLMRNMRDTYIENIFYKPTQDVGSVTICYSTPQGALQGADTSNSNPFPTLITHFEIIPVVDVK